MGSRRDSELIKFLRLDLVPAALWTDQSCQIADLKKPQNILQMRKKKTKTHTLLFSGGVLYNHNIFNLENVCLI